MLNPRSSQINSWAFCHTPKICNLINMLISYLRSSIESDLSDTDNIVPFENTTPINQNKRMQSRWITLIGVVFLNGAVLSVSDKSDSVNKCTQEIKELIKLHILGVWQMPVNFLGNWLIVFDFITCCGVYHYCYD